LAYTIGCRTFPRAVTGPIVPERGANGDSDMSVWGKVIGGVGGFMLGGPLGALLGAAAGYAVDKEGGVAEAIQKVRAQMREIFSDPNDQAARIKAGTAEDPRRHAFVVGVITLAAKMAKADGRVTRDEVDAFKRVFRIPRDEMAAVGAVFDKAKTSADGHDVYAMQIAALFEGQPEVLEELLGALYRIAMADGALEARELVFLREVARRFRLPEDAVDRLRARFEGPVGDEEPDPYTVLGVPPDATDDEVRAAWTRLARMHHPDRLIAQGLPDEFVEQATRTMATINHAYDRVRERRGQG